MEEDLAKLRAGNVKPTAGDTRCIAYGHLIRLAIWNLRKTWDKNLDTDKRLSPVSSWLLSFGGWAEVERHLAELDDPYYDTPLFAVRGKGERYGAKYAERILLKRPLTKSEKIRNGMSMPYFSCLESEFLVMPKGSRVRRISGIRTRIRGAKGGDQRVSRNLIRRKYLSVTVAEPISIVVLRTMLGFTPPEWGYVTTQRTRSQRHPGLRQITWTER